MAAAILLQSYLIVGLVDEQVQLIIAYDGTGYEGWQVQKIGTGVQGKIEDALGKLFPAGPAFTVQAAPTRGSRLGNGGSLRCPGQKCAIQPRKLALALNAWLPEDAGASSGRRRGFHARFNAVGKLRYFVWNHAAESADSPHGLACATPQPEAIRRAAPNLGKHDFQSFAANAGYRKSSHAQPVALRFKETGPLLTFIIEGDGFYKMCRGSSAPRCGRSGKFSAETMRELLERTGSLLG